jgi:hypothetical protein
LDSFVPVDGAYMVGGVVLDPNDLTAGYEFEKPA